MTGALGESASFGQACASATGKPGRMLSLFARAFSTVGKTVVVAAVNAAANELRRPETQQRIIEGAKHVGAQLRDPKTAERVDQAVAQGARALGRAVGNWRNRT